METLRVLVTDDEPGMRSGVVRGLDGWSTRVPELDADVVFVVEQAESGEEALARIRALAPDILLLDHQMPGLSGLEVLDRVAALGPDMLTVMITAYASIETAVLATKRGAWEFLPKPFTPAELRDTMRKTAARLLLARRARALEDEKKQVRFEFVRVLGHELKAPLNAVLGYLEIVRDRHLGGDLAAYDEIVGRSVVRIEGMRRMIGDLLDLTRIESGLKQRRLGETDVRAVACLVAENFRPDAERRGITIAVADGAPVPLRADAGELEMILGNLVSNAVKYNRDGGAVRIAVRDEDDAVAIEVADRGIGMRPEDAARVFDEFVRIRTSDNARTEGTGLGLAIVRKLVHLHGGRIDVDSALGEGTTFRVRLERAAEAAPAGSDGVRMT